MVARVGIVGLGNMGLPMAGKVAARFAVVGFDASPGAVESAEHSGVSTASSVADLARECDVVILVLPDSDVVENVVLRDGLAAAMASGSVVVDMSSSDPLRTRVLAEQLADASIRLVDAPVSGGVKGARAGTLTIMAGGPGDVLDRVEPVLSTMGTVIRTGGVGSGHAIKALNNMLSAITMLATAEAMEAGRAAGLDDEVMLRVINSSSGRSFSTEFKWPTFVIPQAFNSGFSARLLAKDVRIATSLADALGRPSILGQAALPQWQACVEVVGPSADHTEIARYVDQRGEPA